MRNNSFPSRADERFYKEALERVVWQAYKADIGSGDITVKSFIEDPGRFIRATVTAGEPGTLAGIKEAEWFLKKLDIKILTSVREGQIFRRGEILLTFAGRADLILAAERTLLNLLQRMSGVATAARRLAEKLPPGIRLLATRKTLWGALDKRAVTAGGGGAHRLGLFDAILVKDNHLSLVPDWPAAWGRALKRAGNVKFVEIELQNMKEVRLFAAAAGRVRPRKNTIVMLDNFTPARLRTALKILTPLKVLIEVSGGITEKNIQNYALPGVHFISSGSITMRAHALDLSLQILP